MKAATKSNGFTLRQASKQFQIPLTTLHHWLQAGHLRVLKKPQRRGQSLLVDPASIREASQAYVPRAARGENSGGFGDNAAYRGGQPTGDQHTPSAPIVEHLIISSPKGQEPTGNHLSTAELFRQWRAYNASLRPHTLKTYEITLGQFVHRFPTLPLDEETLSLYLAEKPHSDVDQFNRFTRIRAFYSWLWKVKRIRNPFFPERLLRSIPQPRPHPRFLEKDQVMRVMEQAESFPERVMMELFITTAIRSGELCSLKEDKVFPTYIEIEGKTGKGRVNILPFVYEDLKALAASHDSEFLFVDRKGHPLNDRTVYYRVKRCMVKAGITGRRLGPHTLRHSFGHIYQQEKGDLVALQHILRHRRIETTRIYAELTEQDVTQKYLEFDPGRMVPGRG